MLEEDGIKARVLDSENPEEVEEYESFRYHYWIDKFKYIQAPKRDDKHEHDKYDDHSIHFGALKDDNLIGYSRFILPGHHGLQVHREFEELVHPRIKVPIDMAKCVESSRLVVVPELGSKRHQVAQMIYKLKYQFMSPRPRGCRRVRINPNITYFKPQGVPMSVLEIVNHFPANFRVSLQKND